MKKTQNPNQCTYYVSGMHCASCEVLIEKKLLDEKNIRNVKASTNKGEVKINYVGKKPSRQRLDFLFKDEKYRFSEMPIGSNGKNSLISFKNGGLVFDSSKLLDLSVIISISTLVIIGFLLLHRTGVSSLVQISSASAIPAFFVFGLLAGVSTCAALVGGIVLSMSKQWSQRYDINASGFERIKPHLLFNAGRIVSYGLLGALLGTIGSVLRLSVTFSAVLTIGIALMMIGLALQMLGVKAFQRFQLTMPRFLTRYIADEKNFNGKYMPFIMGALTFFLPCGFTLTTQGIALASGSVITGGLIMLAFVLGTLPMLLFIGLSSTKLLEKPKLSEKFLKIAGVLVLFFAFFNINSQLNVLGLTSVTDLEVQTSELKETSAEDGLAEVVDGKQLIKMDASTSGYTPNTFKVKAGVPVRWEISDRGTSGCTNAVIAKGLFDGQIDLAPGQVSVKEFTPATAGKYKFSCWMGMISGTIEVI